MRLLVNHDHEVETMTGTWLLFPTDDSGLPDEIETEPEETLLYLMTDPSFREIHIPSAEGMLDASG